ncbi:uncharacterized protein LOC112565410 isoform X2 [Pomacea canaliculata]|uniref:uncharacterized protein LOC112565410 isoform X2 n=1 Tax=Pomacea canaliculata TaxID=400727 RepID=UPI000D739278|nr:uncharacterized protein LOC112565410 isoform X2 [Pomacea canaliculata]
MMRLLPDLCLHMRADGGIAPTITMSLFQFVGSPCGYHGPYTFYKAFQYVDDGKIKVLSIGEFFFLKILEDIPVCIGEIQLLWEEKGTNQLLASVRLYFQPQDTPEGEDDIFGEDELLAVSEKLILTVPDLCQLLIYGVSWPYGHELHCLQDLKDSDETMIKTGGIADDIGQAFVPSNRGLYLEDVEKARQETDFDTRDPRAPVIVMSYPQYCRYRAVLKRLETVTDKWLKNALVMAVGGFACQKRGVRVMFCREVCDYPELDDLDFRMDHLAPNLKGRPRKRRLLSRKDSNQDSDSNDYGSDHSSTTSSASATPRVKSQKLFNRNGLIATKHDVSQEEREFLTNIYKFMDKRNSPIDRLPSLGFKQIDLYLFYKAAQQLGGYEKITNKKLWKVLYDNLGGNPGNTSAATCTRRHYEKLILPYEKHVRRMRACQQQKTQTLSDPNVLPSPAEKESRLKIHTDKQASASTGSNMDDKKVHKFCSTGVGSFKFYGKEVDKNMEKVELESAAPTLSNQLSKTLSNKVMETNLQVSSSDGIRGHVDMHRKACSVEDMYEMTNKSFLVQQQTPLEVPVVRHRIQTSIMSPIMHRKVITQNHSQHNNPSIRHTVNSFSDHSLETNSSQTVQSVLRAPEYPSHLSSLSISSASSLPHSHSRASSHLEHQQSSRQCEHHQHSQPQRHHHHIGHDAGNTSLHQHVQQLKIKPAHCSDVSSKSHMLMVHSTQIPASCTAPFSSSHPGSTTFNPPPDLYYGSALSSSILPTPQPAHSNILLQPFCHTESSMMFPPPDQVLSRIQVLHQPNYTLDAHHFESSVLLEPDNSDCSGSRNENMAMDLSNMHARHFPSRGRVSASSRAAERKPRAPMHYIGTSSTNSSAFTSLSKSSVTSQGRGQEMSDGKQQQQQQQQQQEVLHSALFGTQFTALPRPVKPAAVTAGEIAHGLVPTVHPAFMQAILSSPSSLSIYAPQLSAMQQAAYEELVRQKTMSNMVSGHSPT